MAVTAPSLGTQVSVINTEHFVATVAVAGVYSYHVDLSNMVTGDTVELRIYQKILTGDTPMVAYYQAFYDTQPISGQIAVSVPIANELAEANALKFSLNQTAGVSRSFKWKILKY
jgi:hypothetical protein